MKRHLCNRFYCTLSLTNILLSTFLPLPGIAQTELRYIDDQNGDSATGEVPALGPYGGWAQGSMCSGCAFDPDHDTTHDTTDSPRTVQFNFTGISLDIYCIIPNDSDLSIASTYDLTFSLDGKPLQQTFTHSSDLSNLFIYNVSVLSLTDLAQVLHTFTIEVSSPTVNSTLLFDYARYTVNLAPVSASSAPASESSITSAAPASSSIATAAPALNTHLTKHTSLPIIISSVLGPIILVLISSVLIFVYRRRRKHPLQRRFAPFSTPPRNSSTYLLQINPFITIPSPAFYYDLPGAYLARQDPPSPYSAGGQ
ncbi:hypothetical protein BT96DRAFT_886419 [Gymnopus androsaceus JB14]|uniref:Mid2 domain-containing protein n=1 Tax=Gymnopus androsaceus JB14 TaxID=1447944 RepID=A0A6A4H8S0_9AGAR|nr:hypothetical protein BT96DRAFT_886419 [Gymnopus androsaceus JB14]